MADLVAYQQIDMLSEADLGASSSASQVVSTAGWQSMDKNGYQTVTQVLSNNITKITKYHSPGRDSANIYKFATEVVGRFKAENYKLYSKDWISIYGSRSKFSEIPSINYGDLLDQGHTLPGLEVEIFAKMLEGNDLITGSPASDFLYSFRGDDLVNPGLGNDYVNGGSGIDIVRLSGNRAEYTLKNAADFNGIHSVTDYSNGSPIPIYLATLDQAFNVSGRDGNDTFVNVEKVRFDNGIYDLLSGLFEENVPSNTTIPVGSVPNEMIGRAKHRDVFALTSSPKYDLSATKIKNFSSRDKDVVRVSKIAFGVNTVKFMIAKKLRDLDKILASDANFIYNQPRGELIYNANGDQPGFGDSGGVFSKLVGAPSLTAASVMFIE